MISQLHITTSSEFQTSSVACTNFNGTSKTITFSVLGKYYNIILYAQLRMRYHGFLSLFSPPCIFSFSVAYELYKYFQKHAIKACSRPVPQDGIVIPIIQTSQRNDPITFKCKDGYWPTKEFSTFCLENGTWTFDPNDVCSG